jgi:hypothetical protein
MGCVAQTAKRRRKQAVGGYKHLPPRQRPGYRAHSIEYYTKREARLRDTRLRMQVKKRRAK